MAVRQTFDLILIKLIILFYMRDIISIIFEKQSMLIQQNKIPLNRADSTETRYQKALKQITKLINLNNELKQSEKTFKEQIEHLHYQVQDLSLQVMKLSEEKEGLSAQLVQISQRYKELEGNTIKMQKIWKGKKQQNYKTSLNTHQGQNLRISNENGSYVKKIQQLQQKNKIWINKIDEVQKLNEWKNQQLISENKNLKKRIKELQYDFQQLKNLKNQKYNELTQTNLQKLTKEELIKKIIVMNIWSQNIMKDCANLKGKLFSIQTQTIKNSNILSRVYSERSMKSKFSHVKSVKSILSSKKSNDKQFSLEEENRQILKKYQNLKDKIEKFDEDFQKLERQNKKNEKTIEGYEKLLQKQQEVIDGLVKEYEEDLTKMTQNFKNKLIEQRQNFGPKNTDKKLKIIQHLQNENRALKKKFQICSIELTKCFKSLEAYKQKLNDYETSCNILVQENQKFRELLNKGKNNFFVKKESLDESQQIQINIDSDGETLSQKITHLGSLKKTKNKK